jgi:hypothetical protein
MGRLKMPFLSKILWSFSGLFGIPDKTKSAERLDFTSFSTLN